MKLLQTTKLLAVLLFFVSCSKDFPKENPTNEVIIEDVLDLVNVQKIADTPAFRFDAHMVYQDKLYSVGEGVTYSFNFNTAIWTSLGLDEDIPDYWSLGINFMRNGKWNVFTEIGYFEFDSQDWQVIESFPVGNGLFSTEGFYKESEDTVYFIDQTNGKETIYKYALENNIILQYSTYDHNGGGFGTISQNAFVVGDSYYSVSLERWGRMKIARFNSDFTDLELLNVFDSGHFLDSSVALQFDDYMVFGLGGVPTVSNNGNITSDPSNQIFYYYDISKDTFTEMPTPFYEKCRGAKVVTYKNEFYLIGGASIKDRRSEWRNTIEKIEFDFVTP